jgi:hypothetical protein
MNSVTFDVEVSLTSDHIANLYGQFGIDETQYVFDGANGTKVPFEVSKINNKSYTIGLRVNSNTSELVIDGKNVMFNLVDEYGVLKPTAPAGTKLANWNFTHELGMTYGILQYNGTDAAYLEKSHTELYPENQKFRGFIGTGTGQLRFADVKSNLSAYADGDYFVIKEFTYDQDVNNPDNDKFYSPNEIVRVENGAIVKCVVKKSISSNSPSELNTNFVQGTLFDASPDFYVYDTLSFPTFKLVHFVNYMWDNNGTIETDPLTMDASQLLPKQITQHEIVKIVTDEVSVDGVQVNYPQTTMSKITNFLKKDLTNQWISIPTKVMDGDLIIYNKDPNGDGSVPPTWYLLENVYRDVADHSRILVGADETDTLTSVSSNQYDIYKITQTILLSTQEELNMFTNLPVDNTLNTGDYIICVTAGQGTDKGKWKIFDDDFFDFTIDAVAENSHFPIELTVGDCFEVVLPVSPSNQNFNGQMGNTGFVSGEKIMYIGNDEWVKFDSSTALNYANRTIAQVGDLIEITDIDGNLGNDTTLLDVPMYAGNMMFNYFDILYFTGTKWIKAFPTNIYLIPKSPEIRATFNSIGFNSDLRIEQTEEAKMEIYINDLYHDATIGTLNYYDGKLTLNTAIDRRNSKNDYYIGNATLSDFFKYENYRLSPQQMDSIRMTPIKAINGANEGDFDTNFNQYILADVKDVQTF